MLFLVTSVVSLVIGFVLGRVWEIRQDIKRQRASDSARLPSARSDRHAALADRLATLRNVVASRQQVTDGLLKYRPSRSPHAEIPQKRQRKPNYDTRCDLDDVGYRYDLQQTTAAHHGCRLREFNFKRAPRSRRSAQWQPGASTNPRSLAIAGLSSSSNICARSLSALRR
jgi:hypothetical protein